MGASGFGERADVFGFYPMRKLCCLNCHSFSGKTIWSLSLTRFRDIVDAQVTISDPEVRPSGPPLGDVLRCEMTIECFLVGPQLLDVNEAGLEHVLRVTVLDAAILAPTGDGHALHNWPGSIHVCSRQANGSYDQQHAQSYRDNPIVGR